MKFDLDKTGIETVLLPWQAELMRFVWRRRETDSRTAYENLQDTDYAVSRASVINFLNRMEEAGVLNNEPRTGKGGYHGFYTPRFDEGGFRLLVAKKIISKLLETFPDAMRKVVEAGEKKRR